jgi:hypothetical protein
MSLQDRGHAIAKYMLVSLYIRAHQNAQETLMKFLFTSTNLSFLNRFIGLYDNISKGIGMNMTQGLMPP